MSILTTLADKVLTAHPDPRNQEKASSTYPSEDVDDYINEMVESLTQQEILALVVEQWSEWIDTNILGDYLDDDFHDSVERGMKRVVTLLIRQEIIKYIRQMRNS